MGILIPQCAFQIWNANSEKPKPLTSKFISKMQRLKPNNKTLKIEFPNSTYGWHLAMPHYLWRGDEQQ